MLGKLDGLGEAMEAKVEAMAGTWEMPNSDSSHRNYNRDRWKVLAILWWYNQYDYSMVWIWLLIIALIR